MSDRVKISGLIWVLLVTLCMSAPAVASPQVEKGVPSWGWSWIWLQSFWGGVPGLTAQALTLDAGVCIDPDGKPTSCVRSPNTPPAPSLGAHIYAQGSDSGSSIGLDRRPH